MRHETSVRDAQHVRKVSSSLSRQNEVVTQNRPKHQRSSPQSEFESTSRLLQLPRELRDMIYAVFFRGITVHLAPRPSKSQIADLLPVLRSCRQINREVGKHWIGQVTFVYTADTYKLRPLRCPAMRHIMFILEAERAVHWRSVVRIWEGLSLPLDTLHIQVPHVLYHGLPYVEEMAASMDYLTTKEDRWRVLRITGDPLILGYKMKWGYRRQAQPGAWNQRLQNRDGADSEFSATLYLSKKPCSDAGLDLEDCQVICQPAGSEVDDEGLPVADEQMLAAREQEKMFLAIFKRAKGGKTGLDRENMKNSI